jgi:TPR repeat protein
MMVQKTLAALACLFTLTSAVPDADFPAPMTVAEARVALADMGPDVAAKLDGDNPALALNIHANTAYPQGSGLSERMQLYRTACALGLPNGCHNLANLHTIEAGPDYDLAKAVRIFDAMCARDFNHSCLAAGSWRIRNGDVASAPSLMIKGCDLGLPVGCLYAGNLTATGQGTTLSFAAARPFYAKACTGRIEPACQKLRDLDANPALAPALEKGGQAAAKAWVEGDGDALNKAKFPTYNTPAYAVLGDVACNAGSKLACMEASWTARMAYTEKKRVYDILARDKKNQKKPSKEFLTAKSAMSAEWDRARTLFQKRCDLNDGGGCHDLGQFLLAGGLLYGVDEVYQKSCDLNYLPGCDDLAAMWRYDSMPSETSRMIAAAQKACNGGVNRGCSNVGYINDSVARKAESDARWAEWKAEEASRDARESSATCIAGSSGTANSLEDGLTAIVQYKKLSPFSGEVIDPYIDRATRSCTAAKAAVQSLEYNGCSGSEINAARSGISQLESFIGRKC